MNLPFTDKTNWLAVAQGLQTLARDGLRDRDPVAIDATNAASDLFRLVSSLLETGAETKEAHEVIAGAIMSLARQHAEAERPHYEQQARAEARGLAAQLRRSADRMRQELLAVADGLGRDVENHERNCR